MSGRIFQNVVLQLKENTDRTVGVIDGEGHRHRLQRTGDDRPAVGGACACHQCAGGAIVTSEGKTFKALERLGNPV